MSSNNINSVVVNGRLTKDPEPHDTSGEKVYTVLHIAINRRLGEGRQRTIYYDVKVWNGLAKACVKYLRKGGLVSVQGHLDQYDKPATEDSEKERWNFITAEQVEFCSRPKAEGEKAAEADEDVSAVLGQLAAGAGIDELLADYPYLEREDVLAALEYAAAAA